MLWFITVTVFEKCLTSISGQATLHYREGSSGGQSEGGRIVAGVVYCLCLPHVLVCSFAVQSTGIHGLMMKPSRVVTIV